LEKEVWCWIECTESSIILIATLFLSLSVDFLSFFIEILPSLEGMDLLPQKRFRCQAKKAKKAKTIIEARVASFIKMD